MQVPKALSCFFLKQSIRVMQTAGRNTVSVNVLDKYIKTTRCLKLVSK